MILLDWKQAFDNIDHMKLLEALKRIGATDKFIRIIANLYEKPTFRAKHKEHISELKKQRAGIRQGCTLSPFLFHILMTVMFEDINLEVVKYVYKHIEFHISEDEAYTILNAFIEKWDKCTNDEFRW